MAIKTTVRLTAAVEHYFADLQRVRASGSATGERSCSLPQANLLFRMNPIAYIETSVLSYLTSRPSRDVVVTAYQQVTREWWGDARDRFQLVASELVARRRDYGEHEIWGRCPARRRKMPLTLPSRLRTAPTTL